MGLRELVQALEQDVARQVHAAREESARNAQQLVADTRREVAEERARALAQAVERLAEAERRALAELGREARREELVEMRRLLDELRAELTTRLAAARDATLANRLLDEVAGEVGEGPVEVQVDASLVEAVRQHLAARHPDLARRARVSPARVGGGVMVSSGQQSWDNTLPSRLERAWMALEPELARTLFGRADAGD
ncbi:MAG: V-type ATP synthase subunit E [Myxococcota bacterium]